MHKLALADELAEIRAEIARLKLREAALRAHFLRHPDQRAMGRWTRVEVTEHEETRLLPALLPEAIRLDPAYHERRRLCIVRCVPVPFSVTVRPGWPITRDGAQMH